jgi:pimeloyl-ACP methyl ester carboxylesterase
MARYRWTPIVPSGTGRSAQFFTRRPAAAEAISAELLVRSGIGGSVVLVGASIAGFDVRVFASDYPERAAGLVLVDASHERPGT